MEYEGTGSFGGLNLISDLDAMAMAFELCNMEGLDIISTGAVIAYANECFEKGILTKKDIGFNIGFGDADAMIKMVKLIASGEGIASLLGNGRNYVQSFHVAQFKCHCHGI